MFKGHFVIFHIGVNCVVLHSEGKLKLQLTKLMPRVFMVIVLYYLAPPESRV